ncbi:transcription elongation factor GreA [Paenibacillus pasadenensis]|uniref:Transcription elongation factor GreA n=1 Tax=Paenibacillus pasadenensis TaxID=217090 RepID=A0A2N5NCU7_9BACL|nr:MULTISPECIES: transcription elongation factor GreA [Paenibacillus]PLT48162.1 Transcription elongation factor GreA [Paenibacillus pasadenensis]QGG58323.1 transcription elongation factor GreA [Paenibacillus sp. B01]
MANEEIILTAEGLAKLEAELEDLKGPKRRELAQRIKTAISYGDLKENSEYHSAKEDQAFMETRILQIQAMLKKARVADSSDTSKVTVGSLVSLLDQEFDEKLQYRIVAPAEADVIDGKISYESPLGKTLIGKRVGDTVEVDAPMGKIQYKVLEIKSA